MTDEEANEARDSGFGLAVTAYSSIKQSRQIGHPGIGHPGIDEGERSRLNVDRSLESL
jgi:hypothetical protein